jgi:hypothetical protein
LGGGEAAMETKEKKAKREEQKRKSYVFRKFLEALQQNPSCGEETAAGASVKELWDARGRMAPDKYKTMSQALIDQFPEEWEKANTDKRGKNFKKPGALKDPPPPAPAPAEGKEDTRSETFPLSELSGKKLREARRNFKVNGDMENLRHCITPLHKDLPLTLGFQIVDIPISIVTNMALNVGGKKYTQDFEKYHGLIHLSLDEPSILAYVMGNMKGSSANKRVEEVSQELAAERMTQLRGESLAFVEDCIAQQLAGAEERLKEEAIGSDAPQGMDDWTQLSEEQKLYWRTAAILAREEDGWPKDFEDKKKQSKKGAQNPASEKSMEDAMSQKNLQRAREEDYLKGQVGENAYKRYIAAVGHIPIWERTSRASYMMHSWGMDHLQSRDPLNALNKKVISLSQLGALKESVTQSSYMTNMQGIAEEQVTKMVYRAIMLVCGETEDWDYVAASGVVRTGRTTDDSTGQELHLDNRALMDDNLFQDVSKGKQVSTEELRKWGWVADMALSESGRPFKLAIPDAKNKKFWLEVGMTPYGTITVRHMSLLHGGHGGEAGNALWHCTIVPTDSVQLFDGDHLAYVRLMGNIPSCNELKEWNLEWRVKENEMNQQKNWMNTKHNIPQWALKRSTNYAKVAWTPWENSSVAMTARLMCSPNNTRTIEGIKEVAAKYVPGSPEKRKGILQRTAARVTGKRGAAGTRSNKKQKVVLEEEDGKPRSQQEDECEKAKEQRF